MEVTSVTVSNEWFAILVFFVVAVMVEQWRALEVRYALRSAPMKGQRAPLPPDEPSRTFRTVIWRCRSRSSEVSGQIG